MPLKEDTMGGLYNIGSYRSELGSIFLPPKFNVPILISAARLRALY